HLDVMKKAINNLNIDCEAIPVRYEDEVAQCDGIVISGGESTVIGKLIKERGIDKVIKEKKIPIFGTCAGMVLMSKKTDYNQPIFDIIDMEVERNAFGSQKDSFEEEIQILGSPFQGVFIRAPAVKKTCQKDENPKIEILSKLNEVIIALKQGKNIALSFHPELTDDTRLHEYYLKIALDL
ncbi:MAG: pyridoxal 5'-phosphate synthase glutaminase subunit PdxT, partial [Methanobrevibacter sp.]|nr:pyridoxal 5'-phosphate synthase glutaminase subunit PdxT [Methanobrevibacter sp.]